MVVAGVATVAKRPSIRRLAAIVLNYRTPDETAVAVASLFRSEPPPDDVIVVDNDAGRGCAETLSRLPRPIAYLPTDQNLGFSGGMNVGIRHALAHGAERILLVNSDARATPDCLSILVDALEGWPGAGIAGPMILSESSGDTVASLGLSFNARTGRMREHAAGERESHRMRTRRIVDAVSGCFMLVDRRVLERAGLLDEQYFFGFEDLDFCLAARREGFATIIVPEARVYHHGGRSIGARSTRRLYFAARNHLRLAHKAAPRGRLYSFGRGLAIVALNLAHAARSTGGSPGGRFRAVVRGTYHHLISRYGSGA